MAKRINGTPPKPVSDEARRVAAMVRAVTASIEQRLSDLVAAKAGDAVGMVDRQLLETLCREIAAKTPIREKPPEVTVYPAAVNVDAPSVSVTPQVRAELVQPLPPAEVTVHATPGAVDVRVDANDLAMVVQGSLDRFATVLEELRAVLLRIESYALAEREIVLRDADDKVIRRGSMKVRP